MATGPLADQALGAADAPVTVIEYASMTCSHCATFHAKTFPELKTRYIDTGKVRFIFREFPFDVRAAVASTLARCAGDDKFVPLIETLFQRQREWDLEMSLAPLQAIAEQAGFTHASFEQCLANRKLLADIETVRNRANRNLGVTSTPTFFINGKKVSGALPFVDLEKELQPYLQAR